MQEIRGSTLVIIKSSYRILNIIYVNIKGPGALGQKRGGLFFGAYATKKFVPRLSLTVHLRPLPPPHHTIIFTPLYLPPVGTCLYPQSTYFTVRGQSYFFRLPKYILTPHPPLRPASLSSPKRNG